MTGKTDVFPNQQWIGYPGTGRRSQLALADRFRPLCKVVDYAKRRVPACTDRRGTAASAFCRVYIIAATHCRDSPSVWTADASETCSINANRFALAINIVS